ncbi:MAG: trimethylamine methyltransferase family protein [Ignavibacteriales bacterium]|nr:trimethylamine methyltransferase family protein [Ignavibacteriales bacterium]
MIKPLRPSVNMLSQQFVEKIVGEAYQVLEQTGVYVENTTAIELFRGAGARIDQSSKRVCFEAKIIDQSLSTAPHSISMYDATGEKSFLVGEDEVHFDPGSAALKIFDHSTQSERKPVTKDLVKFSSLIQRLENFDFQSTGLISSDVPEKIADCHRLLVALQCCSKPIVTGLFVVEGFRPMYEMLKAVRGGSEELRKRPLAIFDACPSPPLKWSNLTTQSLIDCARAGIPSELVSMPLTGATAPVTLAGALVQLTAENLAGVVITQLASPGAPVIFGGSPSCFDMHTANPPMGAIETMMIDSAYSQIGKWLGLPVHAYIGLSDSKCVDAQAGLETGIGAVLGALSGINVISGGGMMDYESAQSLEKLVIDNDICGMAYRLIQGVAQRDEPIAVDLLSELAIGGDFMTHPHTLQWHLLEQKYSRVINRDGYDQWVQSGKPTLAHRASERVKELLGEEVVGIQSPNKGEELRKIFEAHSKSLGFVMSPSVSKI